jgi:hypothetical protein
MKSFMESGPDKDVGDVAALDPWSIGIGDPRLLRTGEVVERPPAERPTHASVDAIAEWLMGAARQISTGTYAFDEFAWRMLAAGLPLLRGALYSLTRHPQFLGALFVWWRTTGQTRQTLIAHEGRRHAALRLQPGAASARGRRNAAATHRRCRRLARFPCPS